MDAFKVITFAIKESLRGAKYKLLFVAVSLFIFFLFVLIPTMSIPGNTLLFQLSLFSLLDFSVTIFLSVLYAVFVTMQTYAMRAQKKVTGVITTAAGGAGALFAGISGTAFCAACLTPLFALVGIGFGGVLFVLEYRIYFVLGITVLMLIAIYFTARKIQKVCDNC